MKPMKNHRNRSDGAYKHQVNAVTKGRRVNAKPSNRVPRCTNCTGWGHTAAQSIVQKQLCRFCGGEHFARECKKFLNRVRHIIGFELDDYDSGGESHSIHQVNAVVSSLAEPCSASDESNEAQHSSSRDCSPGRALREFQSMESDYDSDNCWVRKELCWWFDQALERRFVQELRRYTHESIIRLQGGVLRVVWCRAGTHACATVS